MLRQAVDLDILVLLVQKHPQLIPERSQVASDLPYRRQVQISTTLKVGVDGQVLAGGARNVKFRGRKFYLGQCGSAGFWEFRRL